MISIISSFYRTDKYLPEFEENLKKFSSELLAAGAEFEFIAIVNDATEREKEFGRKFSKALWFKFVNVGRESVFASWNRGVDLAHGEIIGFWNADDIRWADAVIEAKKLFEQGAELVHFPFLIKRYLKVGSFYLPLPSQRIDKTVPEFSPATKKEFIEGMVCGPFFMITKQLYGKVGPFDEQFKIAGDFDWCVRAAKLTDKIVKAKALGGSFRLDGGGLSAGGNMRQIVENNVVYRRNKVNKIMPEDAALAANYKPFEIAYQGKFIPV